MSKSEEEAYPYDRYDDFPEEFDSGEERVPSYGFDSGNHSFKISVDKNGIRVERWYGGGSPYEAYIYNGFWPEYAVWSVSNPRLANIIFDEVPKSPIEDPENFKSKITWEYGDAFSPFIKDEESTADEDLHKLKEKWPAHYKEEMSFGPVTCNYSGITEPDYAAVVIRYDIPDRDDYDDYDDEESEAPERKEEWILEVLYSNDFEQDYHCDAITVKSFEELLERKDEVMLDWPEKEIRKRLMADDSRWRKFLRRKPKKKNL
jgi:hypothetical protein